MLRTFVVNSKTAIFLSCPSNFSCIMAAPNPPEWCCCISNLELRASISACSLIFSILNTSTSLTPMAPALTPFKFFTLFSKLCFSLSSRSMSNLYPEHVCWSFSNSPSRSFNLFLSFSALCCQCFIFFHLSKSSAACALCPSLIEIWSARLPLRSTTSFSKDVIFLCSWSLMVFSDLSLLAVLGLK